jgi:hypothetical protein
LRSAVGKGQPAPRADPFAFNRAVDDPGEVVAGRAEVADHLPDSVGRGLDDGFAGRLDYVPLEKSSAMTLFT